ncbi:WXG100 family type VII secretion target [Paenibacillus glacialis]|uniref:ESAT-6-like protein n=1 Tax=Paenibacillus glacialis TaxID=494026 RepID=A0A168HR99_9BACL|nr:WXG100 family type VII secretion target [Paenibacillus glacialis]OAB38448.1 hypothetical protein PGLA_20365 [Paenibacillus glacialis]
MAKILVTPEEIDKASKLFRDSFDQSETMVTKLNSTMASMQGQWEGMTQTKFFQQYDQAKREMENYKKMLDAVSIDLAAISKRFRDADLQN